MEKKGFKILLWTSVVLGTFASILAIRQYYEDKKLMKKLEEHTHNK